jgi:hypothetical protein
MPVPAKLKKVFLDSTAECRSLFNFCLTQRSQASDAGIEAAFLQMFKSWEYFFEESVIAYLCGRLASDGNSVVCHIRTPSDDIARKILYQERPYLEWTDVDKVRDRLRMYFPAPNRIEGAIIPNLVDLRHITRVRNAIAHVSHPSRKAFQDLVQGLFGGKPVIKRPAVLLSTPFPADPKLLFFDHYADVLEVAAARIAG